MKEDKIVTQISFILQTIALEWLLIRESLLIVKKGTILNSLDEQGFLEDNNSKLKAGVDFKYCKTVVRNNLLNLN